MTRVRDFVADLARAGKDYLEIKKTVEAAYGDKALKKTAIYAIIKKVKKGETTADQRPLNSKKTVRTPALIASVAAAVEDDRRVSIEALAAAHGTSVSTIHAVLHDDLGLEKKSARWVPKLLNDDQKHQRVEVCSEFVKAVQRHSLAMLDSIVTMDETMVCYHTPQSKKQSQQWIQKGQPGPIKAKVQASRTKQMLLAFFDSKGLIYTHIVPRGSTVNAAYIVKVLDVFMRHLRKKRPVLAEQRWFFHWDNAPVHTANVVKEFLAKKNIKLLSHPPYSPDLAPADYFLFPKLKKELAGNTMTQEEFKKEWEGVLRGVSKDEFAKAFVRWFERCEKCIRIDGDYVEKS